MLVLLFYLQIFYGLSYISCTFSKKYVKTDVVHNIYGKFDR